MVNYLLRDFASSLANTGGDTGTEFVKVLQTARMGTAISLAAVSITKSTTERCKWVTAPNRPGALSWVGGTHTWRLRVVTAQTDCTIDQIILRRLSADGATVKASKASATGLAISCGTTGVKTGTLDWNDGTQNPGTAAAADRFEIVFMVKNANTMSAVGPAFGANDAITGQDVVDTPLTETLSPQTSGLQCKVGTLSKNATATPFLQSIAGLGFAPKFVFFWSTNQTAADAYSEGLQYGLGFADINQDQGCLGIVAADNVTTSNERRTNFDNSAMRIITSASTVATQFNCVTLDADGFTVNWIVGTTAETNIINYMALGGTDLTDTRIGRHTWTQGTAPYDQSFSGLGFQPDFVMFPFVQSNTANENAGGDAALGVGVAKSSTEEGCVMVGMNSAAAPSDVFSLQRVDKCISSLLSLSGLFDGEADFKSFDADGFTITWTDSPAATRAGNFYIALKGAATKILFPTQKTGTTGTSATSGVGFTPKGLMLLSNNTEGQTGQVKSEVCRLSIGAASSTTEEANTWGGELDNASTTVSANITKNNNIIRFATEAATATSTTTNAEAELSAFNSGEFVLNWTAVDAVARQMIAIAFGQAAAPSAGPVAMTVTSKVLQNKFITKVV